MKIHFLNPYELLSDCSVHGDVEVLWLIRTTCPVQGKVPDQWWIFLQSFGILVLILGYHLSACSCLILCLSWIGLCMPTMLSVAFSFADFDQLLAAATDNPGSTTGQRAILRTLQDPPITAVLVPGSMSSSREFALWIPWNGAPPCLGCISSNKFSFKATASGVHCGVQSHYCT